LFKGHPRYEARSAGKRSVLMRVKSENATHFVALPIAAG